MYVRFSNDLRLGFNLNLMEAGIQYEFAAPTVFSLDYPN